MTVKTFSRTTAKNDATSQSRMKSKNRVHSNRDQKQGAFDGRVHSREPLLRGFFPRLLTAADLAVLPSDLPSGPVVYELNNGRLVVMPPPGDIHGAVESNIGAELKIQGERRGLGKARSGGVGVILWKNPDRVVGPDAVFVAKESLPIRTSKEGYLETIPELVVEVRSKNDTGPEISRKVQDYFKAGVRVVWVSDPGKRTVTIYRPGQKAKVLHENDVLTIPDIIPGFELSVREVFQI
jgi:Uma2 family endonuclease